MVKNAADEQQVKESSREGRKERSRELDDIRAILDLPAGLRYIWRILNEAGVFTTSFTGEAPTTFFNEGRREMGLRILGDVIDARPDAYLQMVNMTKTQSKEGSNHE